MLNEILKHIRNYFPDTSKQLIGSFEVKGGTINPFPLLATNQYFLIEGSAVNDKVWKNGDTEKLQDETFVGTITPLKIPVDFLDLVAEIEEFEANNQASIATSESFGGYSISRATTSNGNIASWKNAFGSRLNSWRKV